MALVKAYLNLDSLHIRKIMVLLLAKYDIIVKSKEIKVFANRQVEIKGKTFLFYEGHLKYARKDQHWFALYEFLKHFEAKAIDVRGIVYRPDE
jgi:hypothetical protein